MYEITKSFTFDYGHRVWSQELDKALSYNSQCKCKHLHGHLGTVIVCLEAEELNNGMVLDYTNLKFFKVWLDDFIDHKFIIDIEDPEFERLTGIKPYYIDLDTENSYLAMKYMIDHRNEDDIIQDSFVVVNFVPTSENLARFFYHQIKEALDKHCRVKSVTFKEGPNTSATYTGE